MSITDTKAIPAGSWAVDKTHSSVGFSVAYMAGTFIGTFSDFDGAVIDGALRGSAKVASVQVKDPNLDPFGLRMRDGAEEARKVGATFRDAAIRHRP